jgi:hypothetical protein
VTIIAHLNCYGVPTLVGDLLLSSPQRPSRPVNLPISRDVNAKLVPSPKLYVAGLCQKLVVMNPKLAVAWSGSYTQAEDVFQTLQPLQSLSDPEYVHMAIDAIEMDRKNDLSLLVFVATDVGTQLIAHRTHELKSVGQISAIACAGSGTPVLAELLGQFSANAARTNPSASVDDLRNGFDMTLLTGLHSEEFSTTTPVRMGWGGGFEVARYIDGAMTKIGNLLYLAFRVIHERSQSYLYCVPHFRHTAYWKNLTVVQAIEHEVTSGGSLGSGRRDVFLVGPPGASNIDTIDFSIPDIQQSDAILTFIFDEQDEVSTYASSYTNPVLRYNIHKSSVECSFESMFLTDMIDFLQHRWGRPIVFRGASKGFR